MPQFVKWIWSKIERGQRGTLPNGILYLKGGDLAEEISTAMAKHKMRKGSVHTWPISSWTDDQFFEEKMVIYIES